MYSDPLRIHMWSGPRNISTATMYAFRQRSDTLVVDEPLYASYLAATGAAHPVAEEVITSQERNPYKVISQQFRGPAAKPVVFFKQMTHHLLDLDRSFLREGKHFLLIRDPHFMLPSLGKVLDAPNLDDTGLALHLELYQVLGNLGQEPAVVDSRLLQNQPEAVLRLLCRHLNIPFEPAMLSWPAGPKSEEGVWAPHWYAAAHKTTGFNPWVAPAEPFPDHLNDLLQECLPYYTALRQVALEPKEDNA